MLNHAAFMDDKSARLVVREAPYPQIKPGHVIVKNAALAINPIDWKVQTFLGFIVQSWPTILGSDVAGEIVEVGENVHNLKIGQRVIGHACPLATGINAEAAFQQYTIVDANLVALIPKGMAFEAAAVLPLSVSCAAAALYEKNSLALPLPTSKTPESGRSILIWGGSSSIGSSAIQLARASGLKVIATAASKNFEYVSGLGASAVFDYSKPGIVSDLVEALKETHCVGAFDGVGQSIKECTQVVEQLGGGHVAATGDPPEQLPKSVTANHGTYCLVFDLRIPPLMSFAVFATSIKDNEIGEAIYQEYLPKALANGSFKPSPSPTVVGHGLEQLQAGIDKLKGGVSATKLVVTL